MTRNGIQIPRERIEAFCRTHAIRRLALLKLVEIVGEAATRVSQATQAAHPDLRWREVIGTRNRLIHGYDAVDYDILWEIGATDFPPLAQQLRRLLSGRAGASPQDDGALQGHA